MTADLQSALVAAGEHPNVFALNCGCKDKQKKRNAKHIAHFFKIFFVFHTILLHTKSVLCTPKALYISSMAPRIGILVDVEPHDVDKQPRHGGHEKKMPFA